MNPLVLGLLAWGAYKLFIEDKRPAQLREQAKMMLDQAAANPAAALTLQAQAQELLTAAAGIESGAIK